MASTYTGQHNTEKRRHISMSRAGFEPAIPVFERPKTVRAFERAAIGTGYVMIPEHNGNNDVNSQTLCILTTGLQSYR